MVHIPIWMLSNYPRRLKGVFTKRSVSLLARYPSRGSGLPCAIDMKKQLTP